MSEASILVVDDDRNIRFSVKQCLEDAGYRVSLSAEGGDALEQIVRDMPDLVLLDLAMPVLDGMSVIAELHTQWKHYPTRVIVITAQGSARAAIEAVRLGASDFLEKPFRPRDLRASVASVLMQPRPQFRVSGESYSDLLERARQALCAKHFHLAQRELTRAAYLSDTDAAYLNLAGVVQEARGRPGLAHRFYSRALSADCAYRPAHENLARLKEIEATGDSGRPLAMGGDADLTYELGNGVDR